MDSKAARGYLAEHHFAQGSMKPKIEAALSFINGGKKRKAIICGIGGIRDALKGKAGTIIRD
jgi:carbamate kinase